MTRPGCEVLGVTNAVDTGIQTSLSQLTRQFQKTYVSAVSAGNVTATLVAADVLKGILTSTPAANITLTTPTAALMVAADMDVAVGRGFEFTVINLGGANTITLAAGTGVTLVGVAVVAALSSARFYARYVNISSGTQAVTIYRLN